MFFNQMKTFFLSICIKLGRSLEQKGLYLRNDQITLQSTEHVGHRVGDIFVFSFELEKTNHLYQIMCS